MPDAGHEASFIANSTDRAADLALLRRYARPHRARIGALAVLLLSGAVLQLVIPLVVRRYIDAAYGVTTERFLVLVGVTYVGLAIVSQIIKIIATAVGQRVAWQMTNALRCDLAAHALDLDFSFHREHSPGELIERVDGDVSSVANFLSTALLMIVSNAVVVVGVFVALFITSWPIGVVLAAYAAIAVVALLKLKDFATSEYARVRSAAATLFGTLDERLHGLEDIQSSAAESETLIRLTKEADDVLRSNRSARFRGSVIFVVMHGLYLVGYGSALAVAAVLFQRGLTTIGTCYLVVSYANAIYTPLDAVQGQLVDVQQARASIARIVGLFGVRRRIRDGGDQPLPDGALDIEFEHVSFAYNDEGEVLHDVSFHAGAGTVLGLIGRTGSGKTTVARLIAGMEDAGLGVVRLGGLDLRKVAITDVQERIGVIPQEVQIFPGTIRENLTLFRRKVPDERLAGAIANLGLGDWLAAQPDGLETMLDVGAMGMSAGQAQLLAACRVYLRNPSIVILDEASSRLDAESEELLREMLLGAFAGRTVVVIAHRGVLLDASDNVLVLKDGSVVEYGPTKMLLADSESAATLVLRGGAAG